MKKPAFAPLVRPAWPALAGLAVAGCLALFSLPAEAQSGAAACANADDGFARKAEDLIMAGVAAERKQAIPGGSSFLSHSELTRIARERSCDMALGLAPFSHTDAQGRVIAVKMIAARYHRYGVIGENIMRMGGAWDLIGVRPFGPEEFARATVKAWMESPEHRANILNRDFEASGVGVAKLNGEAVATEVFYGAGRTRGGLGE